MAVIVSYHIMSPSHDKFPPPIPLIHDKYMPSDMDDLTLQHDNAKLPWS